MIKTLTITLDNGGIKCEPSGGVTILDTLGFAAYLTTYADMLQRDAFDDGMEDRALSAVIGDLSQMKLKEAAQLVTNLFEIETITQQFTTPEGRWKLLQDWLAENPKWKKQVSKWLDASPDEAFAELREWISKEAELPLTILKAFINAEIEQRVKNAIAILQECCKERQAMDERKEIAG